MITLDCEQCTQEWIEARRGIPTASRFSQIITTTGKSSTSQDDLFDELMAEHILGLSDSSFKSDDMEHGNEYEQRARAMYSLKTNHKIQQIGGVFLDETRKIMVSPDGLIPELKKGLEIKCPKLKTHIGYCRRTKLPTKYIAQVQGNLWVTGYETWDFVSFHGDWEPERMFIATVKRDAKFIATLDEKIRKFSADIEAYKKCIQSKLGVPA